VKKSSQPEGWPAREKEREREREREKMIARGAEKKGKGNVMIAAGDA